MAGPPRQTIRIAAADNFFKGDVAVIMACSASNQQPAQTCERYGARPDFNASASNSIRSCPQNASPSSTYAGEPNTSTASASCRLLSYTALMSSEPERSTSAFPGRPD